MEVYRFTKARYAGDLSGVGAARYPGRWNLPGQHALYAAGSRALALLEVLVHLPRHLVPSDLLLQTILIPETTPPTMIPLESLPETWRAYPPAEDLRQMGGKWLETFPAFQVPSALIPEEWNIVLSPGWIAKGTLRLAREEPFVVDGRLFFSGGGPQQA